MMIITGFLIGFIVFIIGFICGIAYKDIKIARFIQAYCYNPKPDSNVLMILSEINNL